MIDRITLFLETCNTEDSARFTNFERRIGQHRFLLVAALLAITNGTFFSSLDDVWDVELVNFNTGDVNVNIFERGHDVKISTDIEKNKSILDTQYQATAEGAKSVLKYADRSVARTNTGDPNIFGVDNSSAESAHLMPILRTVRDVGIILFHGSFIQMILIQAISKIQMIL